MNKLVIDNEGKFFLDGIKLECVNRISTKGRRSDGALVTEMLIDVDLRKDTEEPRKTEEQQVPLLDQTIDGICGWIRTELDDGHHEISVVPEMVKALATLVDAREGHLLSIKEIIEQINKITNETGKSPLII